MSTAPINLWDVEEPVQGIVKEALAKYGNIENYPLSYPMDDLGIGSLDLLNFVGTIEERTQKAALASGKTQHWINEKEAAAWSTIGKIVDSTRELLAKYNPDPATTLTHEPTAPRDARQR